MSSTPAGALLRAMHEAVAATLQSRVEDRRWDVTAPAVVVVVHDEGDDDRLVCFETDLLPDYPRPVEAVAALADAIRTKAAPPPAGVHPLGVLLASEAWSLRVPDGASEEEVEANLKELQAGRSIADHPWGVETKMVSGVDVAGSCYVSEYVRGESTDEPPKVLDTTEASDFGGVMVEALTSLLDALLGPEASRS